MLPTKVVVAGIPYTIEKQDRITIDGRNVDGHVTYNTALIQIVDGMPIEVERVVVIHELAHAMFLHTGHNDYREDEDLVETVANVFVQVLRDNPQLVTYLVNE
jgi:Zn-dependent peptidase ImmA (M78 family)